MTKNERDDICCQLAMWCIFFTLFLATLMGPVAEAGCVSHIPYLLLFASIFLLIRFGKGWFFWNLGIFSVFIVASFVEIRYSLGILSSAPFFINWVVLLFGGFIFSLGLPGLVCLLMPKHRWGKWVTVEMAALAFACIPLGFLLATISAFFILIGFPIPPINP